MFHSLDIIHVSAFIVYNNLIAPEFKVPQKEFILGMVEKMQERAVRMTYAGTRLNHETAPIGPKPKRAKRMSHKIPCLPNERLEGSAQSHVDTIGKMTSTCKLCTFLMLRFKAHGSVGEPPKISNVYRKCVKCNVHLCTTHFEMYHQENIPTHVENDDSNGNSTASECEVHEMVAV